MRSPCTFKRAGFGETSPLTSFCANVIDPGDETGLGSRLPGDQEPSPGGGPIPDLVRSRAPPPARSPCHHRCDRERKTSECIWFLIMNILCSALGLNY